MLRIMLAVLLALALVQASASAMAGNRLVGTWKSDSEASLRGVRSQAGLTRDQVRMIEQVVGQMTMSFTDKRLKVTMPDINVVLNDRTVELYGDEREVSYQVVRDQPELMAVKVVGLEYGEDTVEYHFEGNDLFWVYSDSMQGIAGDTRVREYFRRVK
ncbi:MAG: hypothetical protein HY940_01590 [Gammaproteobacteria bacterium]|nr:hypothetical protein [Gammaproteobacteria bacterium]